VIYVDSSVVLAQLLAEDRHPPEAFWEVDALVTSRLLEYEVWNRIHARGLGSSHGEDVRAVLARLGFLELVAPVLARAVEPFPVPVRTLDALHLATLDFLRGLGQQPELATYDHGQAQAARSIGLPVVEP
jgi:predicted nucleic acid-binding protein